jgi:DinB superfamily
MNELEKVLVADSAAAPPAAILAGLDDNLAHRRVPGTPRTIYEELWHIVFWQQMTLDWVDGVEMPVPEHASVGFPQDTTETWETLRARFFTSLELAAAVARDGAQLELKIRCPSPAGAPVRIMTVREQLESLGAHNAYHFGRIVLLRQILEAWPPPQGGFTW